MTGSDTRAIAALVIVAATACTTATAGPVQSPPQAPAPVRVRTTPEAIAKARADSARYPYTAADVHFMTAMIGHHAQAITVSRWAPTRGANPAVQRLAARIINAQQDEIVTMQQWLADRQKPFPEVRADGSTSMIHRGEHGMSMHGMQMPGMLTQAQMQQLEQARGAEFDRLFLTFMIQHHRGAVTMVEELFSSYGAGQDEIVFKFASDVNVDQATEIARMEQMLAALTTNERN